MLENIWNGCLCMCVWESERETRGAVIPCPFWVVSSLFPSVWIVTVLPRCPHPREPNTCRGARARTFAYRHILAVDSLLHLWDGPFFFFSPLLFIYPTPVCTLHFACVYADVCCGAPLCSKWLVPGWVGNFPVALVLSSMQSLGVLCLWIDIVITPLPLSLHFLHVGRGGRRVSGFYADAEKKKRKKKRWKSVTECFREASNSVE